MAWHILVVDDEPVIRWLVKRHFQEHGANVLEAEGARSALEQLEATRFDLVITDIKMPGRSGLWLLERVRQRWPEVPVVVVTGGVPPGIDSGWEREAAAVMLKPLSPRDLYALVECILCDGRARAADARPVPAASRSMRP